MHAADLTLCAAYVWDEASFEGRDTYLMSMVASPCIKLCVMDDTSGLCTGCWRTLAEIGAWSSMTEEEQRRVIAARAARQGGTAAP